MYMAKLTVGFLIVLLFGCNYPSTFDREVWIKHPQLVDTYNPRATMVQDLVKNKLKPGMSRKAVLDLLGKPYREGIEQRLADSIVIPDSISFRNPENLKSENADKVMAAINNFNRLYAKPVYIIRYPVGWSTIDPNFLVIIMNEKGRVKKYRVEQS
jgi:hypothetical protein